MTPFTSQGNQAVRNAPVSVAIVCCVESGSLEDKTVRMVESLRRFGGRYADAEVFAVTARRGPSLNRRTQEGLRRVRAQHLNIRPRHRYRWQHYTNKLFSLAAAEAATTAEQIVWLDSDIVILGDPSDLQLLGNEDFAACAPDSGIVGSEGPNDPNDPFWQRAAPALGIRVDDMPWLTTADGKRIRFYWNSGVFAYKRATQLSRYYLEDAFRFMDRRVGQSHSQVHFMDQVVLGLTVLRLGLRWRALSNSCNYTLISSMPHLLEEARIRHARVLHYHDAMGPSSWGPVLSALHPTHPQVHDWLAAQGPFKDEPLSLRRGFREGLRIYRGLQRRAYYRSAGFQKP